MDLLFRDISIKDAPDFVRWIEDKQAVKYTLSKFLPERNIEWVRSYIASLIEDATTWDQAIIIDDVVIGYCGLSNISEYNRSAEYFIIIGNRNYWNKGFGTIAGHAVLEYGFSTLDLHRIWLTVSEYNHGAIKSYARLGFQEEGRMKEACFRDNRFHDKIVMSIIEEQWHNRVKGRFNSPTPHAGPHGAVHRDHRTLVG